MWYVYELADKEYVFYVGMTQKPFDRYKQHLASPGYLVDNVIHSILLREEWPKMTVIFIAGTKDQAMLFEIERIHYYCIKGHKICNGLPNMPDNSLIIDKPAYKKPKRRANGFANHMLIEINKSIERCNK